VFNLYTAITTPVHRDYTGESVPDR